MTVTASRVGAAPVINALYLRNLCEYSPLTMYH